MGKYIRYACPNIYLANTLILYCRILIQLYIYIEYRVYVFSSLYKI